MIHRLLLAACFCASLLPLNAFCEADVVDDSENYALLEDQQAAYAPPVAHDDNVDPYSNNNHHNSSTAFSTDEPALAKDDRQVTNNNASLLDKVLGLQQEIQELRGQLEIQSHELKLLKDQQLSFYKDLDARLRGAPADKNIATAPPTNPVNDLKTVPVPPITTAPTASVTQPGKSIATSPVQPVNGAAHGNPADEQVSYLAAYELVKNKRFDAAISAMQAFVAKYPHGGYTANAQYWLGELYMVKNDYPQAIEHFNVVLQTFPSSSKCAASLLKTGYALAASGKTTEARTKLQDVIKNYPDTSTARLAVSKLNTLSN